MAQHTGTINGHNPHFQAPHKIALSLSLSGPERNEQSVVRIVGQRQGLVIASKRQHGYNRPENFVATDRTGLICKGKSCGLKIAPLRVLVSRRLCATKQQRSLCFAHLDVAFHPLYCRLVDQHAGPCGLRLFL